MKAFWILDFGFWIGRARITAFIAAIALACGNLMAATSTVSCSFVRPDGTAYTNRVVFRPISTPLVDSPNLVTGNDITRTVDLNGSLNLTLSPGRYRVSLDGYVLGRNAFTIEVPGTNGTYNLLDLITTTLDSSSLYHWGSNQLTAPVATDSRLGLVMLSEPDANPVMVPKAALAANYGAMVKSYGAIGDGIVSDGAAIQAAIDAQPEGGTLVFPPGTYLVNQQLSIFKSLRIMGYGAVIKLREHSDIYHSNRAHSVLWIARPNVTIEGLTVNGNSVGNYHTNSGDGMVIYDGVTGTGAHTVNCIAIGGQDDTASRLTNGPVTNVVLRGVSALDAPHVGISIIAATNTLTHTFGPVSDIVVDGCTVTGSQGDGLSMAICERVRVVKSTFHQCYFDSLHVYRDATNIVIAQNSFYRDSETLATNLAQVWFRNGTTNMAMKIGHGDYTNVISVVAAHNIFEGGVLTVETGARQVLVDGNLFRNSEGAALQVNNGDGPVRIINNTVLNSTVAGIVLNDNTKPGRVEIVGNTVIGSGTADYGSYTANANILLLTPTNAYVAFNTVRTIAAGTPNYGIRRWNTEGNLGNVLGDYNTVVENNFTTGGGAIAGIYEDTPRWKRTTLPGDSYQIPFFDADGKQITANADLTFDNAGTPKTLTVGGTGNASRTVLTGDEVPLIVHSTNDASYTELRVRVGANYVALAMAGTNYYNYAANGPFNKQAAFLMPASPFPLFIGDSGLVSLWSEGGKIASGPSYYVPTEQFSVANRFSVSTNGDVTRLGGYDLGIYSGTNPPTFSAPDGSLYLCSTGGFYIRSNATWYVK